MSVRSLVNRVRHPRQAQTSTGEGPGPVAQDIPADPGALAEWVDRLDPALGEAVLQRARQISTALSSALDTANTDAPVQGTRAHLEAMLKALTPIDGPKAWLLLAVFDDRLPAGTQVETLVRSAELDGAAAAVARVIADRVAQDERAWSSVRILTEQRIVDVQHTATRDVATGIQRVTREVTRCWVRDHGPTLIGWRSDLTAMRALSQEEAHRACWGGPAVSVPDDDSIIVPWRCTYLLPELAIEMDQVARLKSMAEHSGTTLNLIGYDLVPITTAETINDIIAPGFARNLAAARYARNIAAISEAAAEEYRGWSEMLAGTGLSGPRIDAAVLPTEAPNEDAAVTEAARVRLEVGSLPLVLVVGSHEPRKNHVAVLHAAELLWREGRQFSLTFIGGNSWKSEPFMASVSALRDSGRPLEAITAATDELLWGGYRAARFTVFPSLNEGYGLPVAESLACGTPVITSGFGSLKEIADAGGGALLIDPRDDRSILDAMRTMLTDDELHAQLTADARSRPVRTWGQYAEQVWEQLNRS